jgi:histidinol-phosphatase (PHP family)
MIPKVSYHTHSNISDGKMSPEELVQEAIRLNFEVLAITDHIYRPSNICRDNWGVNFYSDKDYEVLLELKNKYKNKIKILIGVEFEWLPTKKEWVINELARREYDLKILSFHLIPIDNIYVCFNSDEENFKKVLQAFGNDIKKFVKYYYENLRDGIKTGLFDVVGHLDIIKIFNYKSKYFNERDKWYVNEVLESLDLIKKFNLKIDLNLQGFRFPIKEQFPSKWILDEAKKRDIEILIGTDAHSLNALDYDINKIRGLIK